MGGWYYVCAPPVSWAGGAGDMVVEGIVESTVCPQCRVVWEEKKILQALSVLWSSSISDEADFNTKRSLLGTTSLFLIVNKILFFLCVHDRSVRAFVLNSCRVRLYEWGKKVTDAHQSILV